VTVNGRPDWDSLHAMLAELRTGTAGLGEVQRESRAVTGVAWSDDGLVKAVVGPRGQLLDLELDPRLFRKPDSKLVAAVIVATVRNAVDEAMRQQREVLDRHVPPDLLPRTDNGLAELLGTADEDLREEDRDNG
jgi:DNA-binding protein YbaB